MNIKKVIPSGYCKGVIRAIKLAQETRFSNPNDKIYILGMIVHNRYITKALERLDIITLDDKTKTKEELIDKIDDGIIIFTAHGISRHIKQKVIDKGLRYVDASCDDVIKTQEIVKEKLLEGYDILYIGKAYHPESLAVLDLGIKIHLITCLDDLSSLPDLTKVFVTNQTTMSIYEIEDIFKATLKIYPDAQFQKEICNATKIRQEAIMNLKEVDLLYIVGDPSSNNSNKLKEIGLKNGIKKVIMLETHLDIREEDIKDLDNIYVTAGASTPTYLTNCVIETLKAYDQNKKLILKPIEIDKII